MVSHDLHLAMAKTDDEVLCLEPSYLLFRRAEVVPYASGIYLYVYPRGVYTRFIAIIIIIATIYRVVLYGAAVSRLAIELLPPGWLADDAGVRRVLLGLVVWRLTLAIRWPFTRVASGRAAFGLLLVR